jgi:hypothetical protein
MSQKLAKILRKDQKVFSNLISSLESSTGNYNIDLKIESEIVIQTNQRLKALGLNPDDTSPEELYYSLNNLLETHDNFLIKKLSDSKALNATQVLKKIIDIFDNNLKDQKVFSLKQATLRKIIKINPPLKTIELMGYRSIDSFIKRENSRTIINISRVVEPIAWQNKYYKLLNKLQPNDFEITKIQILFACGDEFKGLTKFLSNNNHPNVISAFETGQLLITPPTSKSKKGTSILTCAFIIEKLKTNILYSNYLTSKIFNSDLGRTVSEIILNNHSTDVYISKYEIDWYLLSKYIQNNQVANSEVSEFILSAQQVLDDLEKILFRIEPALYFWYGNQFLAFVQKNQIVSLNLFDVCLNYLNKSSLKQSSRQFLEVALNERLMWDYINADSLGIDLLATQISSQTETKGLSSIFLTGVYS